MPDPMGGKRLLDYDCKITYEKSHIAKPRRIRQPGDIRPGTKKGKLDRLPIWIVEIVMPKKLVADIYGAYSQKMELVTEPAIEQSDAQPGEQPADAMAGAGAPAPDAAAPAADPAAGVI